MLLLRFVAVVLGAVTTASVLVLARFVVGIPVLTALGGRAGAPGAGLPTGSIAAALVLGAVAGGGVAGWTAPDRPLLHALGLALGGGALLSLPAVLGPPAAPGLFRPALFVAAVLLGGWIAARLGVGDRPPA